MFITPLDERREWYRYHHLLAELLRLELARRQPRSPAASSTGAPRGWYALHRDPDQAVRHAIAAGDLRPGRSPDRRELPPAARVRPDRDDSSAGSMPSGRRRSRPTGGSAVVRAWTMHFLGRHEEGNAALAAALRAPAAEPMPDGSSSIDATAALIGAAFPGNDVGRMLVRRRAGVRAGVRAGIPRGA